MFRKHRVHRERSADAVLRVLAEQNAVKALAHDFAKEHQRQLPGYPILLSWAP